MKKTIIFIIFGIILLFITCNKNELFANTTFSLVEHDMYQIKDAIDKVAYLQYIDAVKKIGENYVKIIIDAFKKSVEKNSMKENSMEEQKKLFESNSFIRAIFTNEKIDLSDNFKQSLFMELNEAHILNRNIDMVPLRLYSTEKIISKEGMKKLTENLQNLELKKISNFFVLYLLKYYDISKPPHNKNEKILRFESSTPTHDEINSIIKTSKLFFN